MSRTGSAIQDLQTALLNLSIEATFVQSAADSLEEPDPNDIPDILQQADLANEIEKAAEALGRTADEVGTAAADVAVNLQDQADTAEEDGRDE
jgi:hypothetical protein